MENLVEVKNLAVSYFTYAGENCDGKGFNGTDSQAGQGLGGKSDSL